MSKPSFRDGGPAPSSKSNTSTGTTFLRPAPLPPPSSTYPARFALTNYTRSNDSSPSPSNLDGSYARAPPDVRKSPIRGLSAGAGEGEEMVEIPRFKRKELNLALVRRRGPWQRLGWIVLWATWLVNGLAGLVSLLISPRGQADIEFFDVNLMYMLVQYVPAWLLDSGRRLMLDVLPTLQMVKGHLDLGHLRRPLMPFAGVYLYSLSG